MVPVERFELSTHGLKGRYSTTELHEHMVGVQGLEPWASRSQIQRSTKLSYTPKCGTPCWTQTNDTWLRRPLLCSTELTGHIWRGAEVSIPIPFTEPLVFKTRLQAVAINAAYFCNPKLLRTDYLTPLTSSASQQQQTFVPFPQIKIHFTAY